MIAVDHMKVGRATATALRKFGSVTVGGPEWADFRDEIGESDQLVANCLHELRLRGYATIETVEHPTPPTPLIKWTKRYEHTGKELPPEIQPLIDADYADESMWRKRESLRPSRAMETV
jgi:hypothetical protein